MDEVRVLLSSIDPPRADAFARAMCQSRLVACANIIPGVRSHYWWDGELCSEEECVVLMETTAGALAEAMEHALAQHPYDTPKLLALRPDAVAEAFARWCGAQVQTRA